jgi:uncharacterized Rmd1/YagE family protein
MYYTLIRGEFWRSRRMALLNQKLDYTQELVDTRRAQLREERSNILTNWIIFLIVLCVILKVLDFHKNWSKHVSSLRRRVSGRDGHLSRILKEP